jgi:autotransporter-associated beta strand protein
MFTAPVGAAVAADSFALDPSDPTRIVVANGSAGANSLMESLNYGATSAGFNSLDAPSGITMVGLADYQGDFVADSFFPSVGDLGPNTYVPSTIYASDGLHLYVTKDHGFDWTGIGAANSDRTPPLVAGTTIESILVDPANSNIVYVVSSGAVTSGAVTSASGRVFMTTDSGLEWTDISAGLPLVVPNVITNVTPNVTVAPGYTVIPAWNLAIDPRTNDLYLGTDSGVYKLTGGSGSWVPFGNGLPNVQVKDIEINTTTNILTIATYGRGVWQFDLDDNTLSTTATNPGALRATGGVDYWTGPITLTGPTTISANGSQTLQDGLSGAQLVIQGVISDSTVTTANTLTKIGGGDVVLDGADTYGGQTDVNQGNLVVENPGALSGTATIVASGAALELASSLANEPITLNGNGIQPPFGGHYTGALVNVSNTNVYTGTITLASNSTIGVTAGQLTIAPASPADGIVDGGNGYSLDKEGSGLLVLDGPDTYTGGTTITAGSVDIQNASALGETGSSTTTTVVSDGAQLQLGLATPIQGSPILIAGGALAAPVTYYYEITATSPAGESSPSNQESIVTSAGNQQVSLSWNQVVGATGYRIYRSTVSGDFTGALLATITSGSQTAYLDAGATAALAAPVQAAPTQSGGGSLAVATYYYVIAATSAAGVSAFSNQQTVPVTVAGQEVNLSWSAVAGATGYNIYRSTVLNNFTNALVASISLGTQLTYTDTGTANPAFSPAAPPTLTAANETLYISGAGVSDDGALRNAGGNNAWTGNIILSAVPNYSASSSPEGVVAVYVDPNNTLTLSGVVSEGPPPTAIGGPPVTGGPATTAINGASVASGLAETGTGTLVLSGSNSYTGSTYIGYTFGIANTSGAAAATVPGGVIDIQNNNALGQNQGNEIQRIDTFEPPQNSGATFKLTANGNTTAGIPYGASAGTVQTDLDAILGGSSGDTVSVTAATVYTGVNEAQTLTLVDRPVQTAPIIATATQTTGLVASTTYYYVITATGPVGQSMPSNEESITIPSTAANLYPEVVLSWNPVAGATGYDIYRSTTSGSYTNQLLATITGGSVKTYTDTGAAVGFGTPPSFGQFTLEYDGVATGAINYTGNGTVDAAAIQNRLDGLTTIGGLLPTPGSVQVTADPTDTIFTITFQGSLSGAQVNSPAGGSDIQQPLLIPLLTDGAGPINVTELTPGDGGPNYIYTVKFNGSAFEGVAQPLMSASSTRINAVVTEVATGGIGTLVYTGSALTVDGDPAESGATPITVPSLAPLGNTLALNGNGGGVTVTNGGSGYLAAPTVSFSAPPAGGTTPTAVATVVGGVVTGVTVTNPGSGYTSAPLVTFTPVSGGSSATAVTRLSHAGGIIDGALVNLTGNNTLQGDIVLQSNSTISAAATTQLTVTGVVADPALPTSNPVPTTIPASLTKVGTGAVVLAPVAQTITLSDRPTLSTPTIALGGSLVAGTTYYYEITATSASGESLGSLPQTIVPGSGSLTVDLSWPAVAGATGYNVYRSTSATFSPSQLLNATPLSAGTTTFVDNGIAGTTKAPPNQTLFKLFYNGDGLSNIATGTIAYNGTIGPAGTDANIQNALNVLIAGQATLAGSTASVQAISANVFTIVFKGPAAVNLASLTGTFTNSGIGTVGVSVGNTYTGSTKVNNGVLNIQNAYAMGVDTSSVQEVSVSGSSGFFTLQFGAGPSTALNTTPLIPYGVSASLLQADLNALATIGGVNGSVSVTQVGLNYYVYFNGGSLAHAAQIPLVATFTSGISSVSITQALLGGASAVTVASGATIQTQSTTAPTYFTESSLKPLTLNGLGFNNAGALENVSGNNAWGLSNNPITLGTANVAIGADGSSNLFISQPITDGGGGFGVNKVGSGTVQYDDQTAGSTDSTYTGLTNVVAGTLQLNDTTNASTFAVDGNLQVGDATPIDQVQTFSLSGFTSGTTQFTLTYNGNTTAPITYYGNGPFEAAAIQAALNLPAIIGAGNTATVNATATPNQFTVTFGGGLAGTDPAFLLSGTPVTAGTVNPGVITTHGAPAEVAKVSQVQTFSVTGFNQGDQFTLTYNGHTTSDIIYYTSATFEAAAIQALLNLTSIVGAGNTAIVNATTTPGQFTVTFGGNLAGTNPAFLISGSAVLPATGTVSAGVITTVGLPIDTVSAVAQLEASNQINPLSSVTVDSDGTFDLNHNTQSITTLTMTGGTTTTGVAGSGGTLTVTGNATLTAGATLNEPGTGSQVNVNGTLSATSSFVNLSGSGSTLNVNVLTMTDTTLTESGPSSAVTVSGLFTMTGGEVNLSGASSVMTLDNNLVATSDPESGAADITGQGTLALSSTTPPPLFTVNPGVESPTSDLVVSAVITGSNGLTKTGLGRLELDAINTYTGTTLIDQGDVQLDGLGSTQIINLYNPTAATVLTLTYNGNFSSFDVTGNSATDAVALKTALLSVGIQNSSIANIVLNYGNPLDLIFTLTFTTLLAPVMPAVTSAVGTGNAFLTTLPNNIAGSVFLNGGATGASLSGTGALNGINLETASATGTVNPGDNATPNANAGTPTTAGILNVNGNVNFTPDSTFSVDLSAASGTHPDPIAGYDYDQLSVNGNVSLNGALLTGTSASGIQATTLTTGDQFTIIQATGFLAAGDYFTGNNGVSANAVLTPGSSVFINGQKFTIQYNTGASNTSVVLTRVLEQLTSFVLTSSGGSVAGSSATSTTGVSVYGQDVTFTARAVPEAGATFATAGATVTFTITDLNTGTFIPLTVNVPLSGVVTFTPQEYDPLLLLPEDSPPGSNTFTVTAQFGAPSVFNAYTASVQQTVNQNTVTIGGSFSVPVSSSAPVYGQPDTFTATITPATALSVAGASTPNGDVTFALMQGATTINTYVVAAINGQAMLTLPNPITSLLPAGSYQLAVSYNQDNSDPNYAPTAPPATTPFVFTYNVQQDSTSVVFSPPTVTSSPLGQPSTFYVTVNPGYAGSTGLPNGTLTFYDGPTTSSPELGTVTGYAGGTVAFTPPSDLALGAHTITVTFTDTDGNYKNSPPASLAFTVAPAITSSSFISETPANPLYGQTVTFNVSVLPNPSIAAIYGLPGGNVILSYGPTVATSAAGPNYLGTGSINTSNQQAQITTQASALPQGNLQINAYYQGNTTFGSSTAVINPFTVGPAADMVTVSANPLSGNAVSGQPVVLTATVSSSVGTPSAGTVVFTDTIAGPLTGTVTNLGGGVYQLTTAAGALTAGSHLITATYTDTTDTNYATNSGQLPYTVGQANDQVVVSAFLAGPTTYGTSVTFTATITALSPGSGVPTNGVVSFTDTVGGNTIPLTGTVSNPSPGVYKITTTATQLSAGSHTITAFINGDTNLANNSGSLGGLYIVGDATAAIQSAGVVSGSLAYGASPSALFQVVVQTTSGGSPGSPTGNVVVTDTTTNTVLSPAAPANAVSSIGATQSQLTFNIPATLNVGLQNYSVTFTGSGSFSSALPTAGSFTITPAATTAATPTTTAPISVDYSLPTVGSAQPLTLTAQVTTQSPSAAVVNAGTVTFTNTTTGQTLGTANVTVVGGVGTATLMLSATTPTLFSLSSSSATVPNLITATYNAPTVSPINFQASAPSSALSLIVLKASTVTATPSATTINYGQTVNVAVSVASLPSGLGTPGNTGTPPTITIMEGATVLGTGQLNASGVVTGGITITPLNVGAPNNLTVTYDGDKNFASSFKTLSITENPAVTTTSLTPSPSGTTEAGQSVTFTAVVTSTTAGTPATTAPAVVTFYDKVGAVTHTLGTGTLTGTTGTPGTGTGTATYTFNTTTLPIGPNSITATYSGSTPSTPTLEYYAASPSTALAETVDNGPSLGALSKTQWTLNQAGFSSTIQFTKGGTGQSVATLTPPAGLVGTGLSASMFTSTGVVTISGTPNAVGPINFSIAVTDVAGVTVSMLYTITINAQPSLPVSTLPTASYGTLYSTTIPISGGTGPFTISPANPTLPPGLKATISGSNVIISGTPTATSAAANYLIGIKDVSGATATQTYSITVQAAATSITAVTASATKVLEGSAVTYTATVYSAVGSPRTGTVVFTDSVAGAGGGTQSTVSLVSTTATTAVYSVTITYPANATSHGPHTVTAQYQGSTDFAASAQATSPTVNVVNTSIKIAASTTTPQPGGSVTFTITLTAIGGAAGQVVTLTDNNSSTPLKSFTLPGSGPTYTLSYTTTFPAGTTNVITASFDDPALDPATASVTVITGSALR